MTSPIQRVSAAGVITGYGDSATTDTERGTALVSALAATASGDTVLLAQGTYDTVDTQIHAATATNVIGSGIETILTNAVLLDDGPMVRLIRNGGYSDLAITYQLTPNTNNEDYQAAIGVTGSQSGDGCVCRNLTMTSDTDIIYINSTAASNVDFYNCSALTKWDGSYIQGNASTLVRVFGSEWEATGDSATNSGICEPFLCTQGTLKIYGTRITSQNATNITRGVQVTGASAVVECHSCSIITNSNMGSVYDLYQANSGTLLVEGCSYDSGKTFGVITQATRRYATPISVLCGI